MTDKKEIQKKYEEGGKLSSFFFVLKLAFTKILNGHKKEEEIRIRA